jgi:ABC-2 type transport system ATP-binding protein
MEPKYLAELSEVSKRFGKTIALDGLSLEVRPGELLSILGPNGAGKSTAISLMLGLEQPDKGSARLFGESPLRIKVRRRLGVMMQEAALAPELRTREQIDLAASYYTDPMSPAEAMRMTDTEALADRPYGKLSGGQKRQVQFAMAVCGRPALLFLDEPTVGLDLRAREMVWVTLRRLVSDGCSIVLTTHYLEEAEALADRLAVLARGRVIASGTVNEIRAVIVRKQISCSTSLPIEAIRAWAEVETVSRNHRGVEITANNAEAVVQRLFAGDEDLEDLEVHRAGLAQAFTELTQENTQ